MNELIRLLNNLNLYLEQITAERNLIETIAVVWSPIIATFAVIIGGIFALYKYVKAKNYDINIQILQEVYTPLYSHFVKQETFREIAGDGMSQKESPILDLKRKFTKTQYNLTGIQSTSHEESYLNCSLEDFLKVLEKTNLALASERMVTLLNMYQVLIDMSKGNDASEKRAKAIALRMRIEQELRIEIISGYMKYGRKLGTHSKLFKNIKFIKNDIYKWDENGQFSMAAPITSEEISKVQEHIRKLNNQEENS